MAGSFTSTGTISNLTRLELEQLRKADFTAGGKALTKGDGGQSVGVGDFNAEQFFTSPTVRLEDVSSMSPPSDPAADLGIIIQDSARANTPTNRLTVRWYGPRLIHSGVFNNTRVTGFDSTTVEKNSSDNDGEALNDYIVFGTSDTPGGDQNTYLVGTISTITPTKSTRRFSLTNIYNPFSGTPTNVEFLNQDSYRYSVWRRDVVQLFAYPGSGPATGREQTFLMVQADPLIFLRSVPSGTQSGNRITATGQDFTASPAVQVGDTFSLGFVQGTVTQIPPSAGLANDQLDVSFSGSGPFIATIYRSLHKIAGPTTDQINQVRVRNVVPPNYTSVSSKDRSDAIFEPVAPAARTNGADTLGYRVVLYPSLPNGTGPDFDKPITSLNPIIDPSIPSADQRFTIDYKAGIVRFSCAPSNVPNGAIQPDIKPVGGNGGCDLTTGRLNLYATFMAIEDGFVKRSSEALKAATKDSTGRPTAATISVGNLSALGSNWDVFPGRLRLNNASGAAGTDPILYESAGVLKTGRADFNESDVNPPPVLEHRGQLLVGGGLVGALARTTPRIKHVVSTLSEGPEGRRTIRSEATKGTGGFAATREYAYDANFANYDMYEQTHNARWDTPSQLWVKDQGSGSAASRLYIHNSGLVFQTETSAASSFGTDTTTVVASGASGTYNPTYDSFFGDYFFSSLTQTGFDFTPYVGKKFTITSGADNGLQFTINSVGPNDTIHFFTQITNYFAPGPFVETWQITNSVAWLPGPINVGAITATAATVGGVAFSTVNTNLTNLTNSFNSHATSSDSSHDGRYAFASHTSSGDHDGRYLRKQWSVFLDLASGYAGIATNQTVADIVHSQIQLYVEVSSFPAVSFNYHGHHANWANVAIQQAKVTGGAFSQGDIYIVNSTGYRIYLTLFGFDY